MPDYRGLRRDLAVFVLLVIGLLAAVSVLTFDPADAPGATVYPPRSVAKNLLGSPGAWVGEVLQAFFGLGVYPFLGSWFVLVVLLFLRRGVMTWLLRLLGWLLAIPAVALLGNALPPGAWGTAVSGGGGYLGSWIEHYLSCHLHPIGQAAVYASGIVASLFLALDFVFVWMLERSWHGVHILLSAIARLGIHRPLLPRLTGRAVTPSARPKKMPANVAGGIPIHHAASSALALSEQPRAATDLIVPIAQTDSGENGRFMDFELPPLSLLRDAEPFPYDEHDQGLRERAAILEKTFTDFGLNVRVVGINTGPVITQYEVSLETGLRLHKVTRLADDLALNLKVPSVRMVAPIPGKNTVGVEIPNEHRAVVRLKEVILAAGSRVNKAKLPLFLGKDTEGRALIYDLAEMPHLLIAGRTGTGKSVCMNAIILSLLMTRRPDEIKMIMIDPKMLELSEYGKIPHLMHPVVKDMKKAEAILSWAVDKMEERYDILSRARVRSIAAYNELPAEEILRRVRPADDEERARVPTRMPYIVIFVDEMNDLMMTMKKEVEGHIIRLAQKSRAAGIHLVVATQKPTVDVITGLIKSNLPARICFQVSSRSDSRVVLDEMGADKLLGKGDMLFLQPGTSTLIRSQGTYTGDDEISRVVEHLECDPCYAQELVQLSSGDKAEKGGFLETLRARDELYEQAIEVILREGRGSVSLLQRALGIGYGRAARLIDFMAEDGIVGDYNGSQAREVLYTPEQWQQLKDSNQNPIAAAGGGDRR
jgi:S-DNA-T family DNA segregation ATPase FtsK/SpoIIIE